MFIIEEQKILRRHFGGNTSQGRNCMLFLSPHFFTRIHHKIFIFDISERSHGSRSPHSSAESNQRRYALLPQVPASYFTSRECVEEAKRHVRKSRVPSYICSKHAKQTSTFPVLLENHLSLFLWLTTRISDAISERSLHASKSKLTPNPKSRVTFPVPLRLLPASRVIIFGHSQMCFYPSCSSRNRGHQSRVFNKNLIPASCIISTTTILLLFSSRTISHSLNGTAFRKMTAALHLLCSKFTRATLLAE